jgi:serine/threonine-protein kinase
LEHLYAPTRLGPYEIGDPLGSGGMGEVYRAHDARLRRDVALKLLPPAFAQDPDRMARFGREAQVLAALNHPNIAAIYGLEESEGVRALVMELVEGPILAERIAAGPIPVEEALPLAKKIAEALEYAHERAIIHRDLKPANIKLTADGHVKLLDFGPAKAMSGESTSADPAASPTLTMRATVAGVILGTAGYMAPEQARGMDADKRADIWAFGVVLFEMLTGRHIFTGETVSDTLAAVLRADLEWSRLPDTPEPIRRLLRRCLERDRKRRMCDIGDARLVAGGNGSGRARGSGRRVHSFPRNSAGSADRPAHGRHAGVDAIRCGLPLRAVTRWPAPGIYRPQQGWPSPAMDPLARFFGDTAYGWGGRNGRNLLVTG